MLQTHAGGGNTGTTGNYLTSMGYLAKQQAKSYANKLKQTLSGRLELGANLKDN